MARPQKFNKDSVLNSAMQLFWQKGYANTSIKDLTEVTQLQPGSLYGAFKNKRNLFILSLDRYFEQLNSAVSCILQTDEAPIKRIRQFFDYLLSEYLLNEEKSKNHLDSCLLVNTLLEVPVDDEAINHRVSAMFAQIEQQFVDVLLEAQKNGTLQKGLKVNSVAKMLISGIFGLQVYNRLQTDKSALREIVDNLLSNIEA